MSPYVATVGTFDGFHRGHQDIVARLLLEARTRGLKSQIITFPTHPLSVIAPERTPKLIYPRRHTIEMLKTATAADEISVVDFTPELAKLTAREFMAMLRQNFNVQVLVMGYDNSFGSDRLRSREGYVAAGSAHGIEVLFVEEYVDDESGLTPSSSLMRRLLRDGQVDKLAKLLGRDYHIDGTIEHGLQNGRKLGFPTFNLHWDAAQEIPGKGVYAGFAEVKGIRRPAVINIGLRPTFGDGLHLTIEAHAIGHDYSDCYGLPLSVTFTRKIRDEKTFPNLAALQAAIAQDIQTAAN